MAPAVLQLPDKTILPVEISLHRRHTVVRAFVRAAIYVNGLTGGLEQPLHVAAPDLARARADTIWPIAAKQQVADF